MSMFNKGSHEEALAIRGRVMELSRGEEALRVLDENIALLAGKNVDTSFKEARVYAGLGEKDKAFELLNSLYEKRSSQISILVCEHALHSLHGDPRFEELVRKVGFPVIPGPKKGQNR